MGRGDAATLSPGHLSLALEVRWEKALASASHMITKHTEFAGVFNKHMIKNDKQKIKDGR